MKIEDPPKQINWMECKVKFVSVGKGILKKEMRNVQT